jgi:hypothetical protein
VSVFDRAVEIYSNIVHCIIFQKILFTLLSKFMILYHSLDLSYRISIRRLRVDQIHDTVAIMHKYRGFKS